MSCLRRTIFNYARTKANTNGLRWSSRAESFLNGCNANFLEAQYLEWANSKGLIDSSWDNFYGSVSGPTLNIEDFENEFSPREASNKDKNKCPEDNKEDLKLQRIIVSLFNSYQTRGHLLAKTDPLSLTLAAARYLKQSPLGTKGIECSVVSREMCSKLLNKHMDTVVDVPEHSFIGGDETQLPVREMIERLEKVYCGSIGVEYMHLLDVDCVNFIRKRMETPGALNMTPAEKRDIMRRLIKSCSLERYFGTKWPSEKRFGADGGESLIVLMEEIVDRATENGIQSLLIAMPHRGRLNTLVNVCRKQLCEMFGQFKHLECKDPGSGDIACHLGAYVHRFVRKTSKFLKISMSSNPAHLEVVAAVALGKCRAQQIMQGDTTGDKTMTLIMHGDAAHAGQGVVYETTHLTKLPNFTTHGSIHVVVNNQIGYTTDPRYSRSSPYCSDVALCVDAPVFHVNSDDPEAVAFVGRLAIDFRCKFKKDVYIDLICYRRFGHSEADEPTFTQPSMYKRIREMKPIDQIYAAKIKAEGSVSEAEIAKMQKDYDDAMNKHFEICMKVDKQSILDWLDIPWIGFFEATDPCKIAETGVSRKTIETITNHFCKTPEESFVIHKGVARILAGRKKLLAEGKADWAIGEALAFGSLLRDKIHIRFTGEDVERGTMAHRHHVYHHQNIDGVEYRVLDGIYPDQALYSLHNSSLSEYGVVAFETGYSNASPYVLALWEAQYGDFADTGQALYDNFLANGETKWGSQSGLVVQLPHGLDGAGPEHSSARPERYLQACEDDEDKIPDLDDPNFELNQLRNCNWIVANVTNSANYFHLMRRQIALPFRKPIILMSPKVGLKHAFYHSPLKDFELGTRFRRAIPEDGPASKNPDCVQKLIFCSGKVSITVHETRKEQKLEEKIAMCRIEQLNPFPYDIVLQEFAKYSKAKVCFVQEEHKNQGPWAYCRPRLENLLCKKIDIATRPPAAASATGFKYQYQRELKALKEQIVKL